jgi:hypothetical protein
MNLAVIDEAALLNEYRFSGVTEPVPSFQGTHQQSATQRYAAGSRFLTADGRVFKYGYARTALLGGYGSPNYFPVSKHITYAVLPVAMAVGDTKAKVTFPSSCGYASTGFAADELVGGTIVVGHNAANVENFQITGNDLIGSQTSTAYIQLSQPVGVAHPVTDGAEAYPNPYAYLGRSGGDDHNAFMGVPARNISSGYWAWTQTWGPALVCPGGGDPTPGENPDDRTAYFVGDGSVNFGKALTVENGYQVAGFCIDTTSVAVSAMPLVCLQISL